MIAAVFVLALMALGAALYVASPLLAPEPLPEAPRDPREVEAEALRDRRDAAYAALRELDLEHRTGKLNDADHALARRELRTEAVEALRALERVEGAPPAG